MHDQGLRDLPGERDGPAQGVALSVPGRVIVVEVEPRLPDGDHPRVGRDLGAARPIALRHLRAVMRVDADRRRDAGVAPGQLARLAEVAGRSPEPVDHQVRDPRCLGPADDASGVGRIVAFLDHLEQERGCGIATRNVRLAAVRTFFRYIARRQPAVADLCRRVAEIPAKKRDIKPPAYLERDELDALLAGIDRKTALQPPPKP